MNYKEIKASLAQKENQKEITNRKAWMYFEKIDFQQRATMKYPHFVGADSTNTKCTKIDNLLLFESKLFMMLFLHLLISHFLVARRSV